MGFFLSILLYITTNMNFVEGKVIDSKMGDDLVMVQVSSSIETTYTDINGNYRISYAEGDSLTFKYVGYNTLKVCVEDCGNVSLSY